MALDDLMVPPDPSAIINLVGGGDASDRGNKEDCLYCYAISAGSTDVLRGLAEVIQCVLTKHLGDDAKRVHELHAKTIWNGDERRRSPFSQLRTKAAVVDFLFELAQAIASTGVYLVAAVTLSREDTPNAYSLARDTETPRHRVRRMAIYGALSRLDLNISILTGKHLGSMHLYMDRESRGVLPQKLITEVAPATLEPLKLYPRIDPIYISAESESHTFIQVADLVAYAVGKYLSLHGSLLRYSLQGHAFDDAWRQRAADCNFFLFLWSVLNTEVVLVVDEAHVDLHPLWASAIIAPYTKVLKSGVNVSVCSVREAVGRTPEDRPSVNGVGYWAIPDVVGY